MIPPRIGMQSRGSDASLAAYRPIADYALIGDAHTAALISIDGSIDWLCLPFFDDDAVFCKLLDARKGGFFRIGPDERCDCSRSYLDHTNVLVTTFRSKSGVARLTDFMPFPRAGRSNARILRLLECVTGHVDVTIEFRPTLGFARKACSVVATKSGAHASSGSDSISLFTSIPLDAPGAESANARTRVRAGEKLWFELVHGEDGRTPDVVRDALLDQTVEAWRRWMRICTYQGPYRDQVCRSELALKLLTFEPTGAVIAAPTTSLPEAIGGVRNWDYRFSWLRDAALILYALQTVGYHSEAIHFFDWLEGLGRQRGRKPQILYRISGESDVAEKQLDHLEGYRGSRPVRIGNAAADQSQLDVYGQVLDAAHLCFERVRPLSRELLQTLRIFADEAARRWQEPDQGLWEVRGGPRHFLYSKLMCWVAVDRALKLFGDDATRESVLCWRAARRQLRRAILEAGYDDRLGAFTQALGERALDASALAIPLVGFLPASDPRVQSTAKAIQARLTEDGLVRRYDSDDGLPGGEGAFTLCTFWLVDNLALGGRLDEARAVFDRVAGCANDVGLLSEQVDPRSGELLGNFPQGYSHMAMIRSVLNVAKAEKLGPDRRAKTLDQHARELERSRAVGVGAPRGRARPVVKERVK